jgi:heme-degrading monooxygenase HmoA
MYAAIRQFKAKPGSADALAERIKGAVPIISEVSGFMATTSSMRPTTR